jgi:hypothetical protein
MSRFRRPHLFVVTLKYSGKSFRKVVWKANQENWASSIRVASADFTHGAER